MRRGRVGVLIFVGVVGVVLGACAAEEREIGYKPFLHGLPGAHTAAPASEDVRAPRAPVAEVATRIVVEHEDGSVTLISRSPRHLTAHIQRTLVRDQRELFVEQVLSERTKREYLDRGRDPSEAFDALKLRQSDVLALFARMPFGEQSPNAFLTKVEEKVFRLKLTGAAGRDLRWTSVDMIVEGGQWRLLWFGN
jgi:hypothetical protein